MTTDNTSTIPSRNVWIYKPWWCQPWSILLTGIGLIAGSWLLLHRIWITGCVAVPILLWMSYFLLVYPRLFQAAVEQAQLPDLENEPRSQT